MENMIKEFHEKHGNWAPNLRPLTIFQSIKELKKKHGQKSPNSKNFKQIIDKIYQASEELTT